MIIGVGTDILDVNRIDVLYKNYGNRLINRILTKNEKSKFLYYSSKDNRKSLMYLAKRFCAKESVVKAMGLGFGVCGFLDVEILNDDFGKPFVVLSDRIKEIKNIDVDKYKIFVSISDETKFVVSYAIIELNS